MSVKKQYLKKRNACKVTFSLPKEAAEGAKSVHLVGEFNDWSTAGTPMKKSRNGDFSVTLELASGREYQYRYLVDETRWENDWAADRYVPTPFGNSENSVVVV
ncbi:MAG: isoamylase early set domain-containing protein [Thermodesulfobacteriota bacterium]